MVGSIGAFEHASLQINFGTMGLREAQTSMRLFAREVMPEFAGSLAAKESATLAQAK